MQSGNVLTASPRDIKIGRDGRESGPEERLVVIEAQVKISSQSDTIDHRIPPI